MGRQPDRWVTLAASLLLQLCAGTAYAFGTYSSELKASIQGGSQSDIVSRWIMYEGHSVYSGCPSPSLHPSTPIDTHISGPLLLVRLSPPPALNPPRGTYIASIRPLTLLMFPPHTHSIPLRLPHAHHTYRHRTRSHRLATSACTSASSAAYSTTTSASATPPS